MIGVMPTVRRSRLRLLKIAGKGCVEGVFASDWIASLMLHWIGRRSYLCPVKGCPACDDLASRWSGFAPVLVNASQGQQMMLLELTACTWDRFHGLMLLSGHHSLFGLQFCAQRARTKSPLVVDPLGQIDMGERQPIEIMRVYDALATLYGLPSVRDGEGPDEWSDRAHGAALRALELALIKEGRDC